MTFAVKVCGNEQAVSIIVVAENGIQARSITA
jgi:hypothetical protein